MVSENIVESVLSARYYGKNEKSWSDVCARVSNFIGDDEQQKKDFFNLMNDCKFLPNSPTLFNAGMAFGQLSACFVTPVHDTMESIFDAIKNDAMIFKSGGGVGMSFCELRQKNSAVGENNGVASGVVSFMRVFDAAIEAIKAGGKRRGAALGSLPCNHGDIMDFIKCKSVEGQIRNFNLSVMITDEFMDDVKNKRWNKVVTKEILDDGSKRPITVKEIWNGIVDGSWKNGEPAILFDGHINNDNMLIKVGRIESTNPCGELPLLPFESCNLGSINLSKYFVNGSIDTTSLKEDTKKCVHFLNNVIDKNAFPLDKIKEASNNSRKIGLGIMGYHDLLIKMRIPYDSNEALNVLDSILKLIRETAEEESHKIALEFGSFPLHALSEWEKPMRNANVCCIAPTGSISLIAQCSPGLEPLFSLVYKRTNTVNKEFLMVNDLFDADLKKMIGDDKALYEKIITEIYQKGSLQEIDIIPDAVKAVYKTALDISPEWHVKTQARAQKWIDSSISKTVNLPNNATKEDVARIFIQAYDSGCKGLTMYRNGSRNDVVMSTGEKNDTFSEIIRNGKVYRKCGACGFEFESDAHCLTCPNCANTKCS